MPHLERFKLAQDERHSGFDAALSELRAGRKTGHWIWYVFPQLAGLGSSPMAVQYGVEGTAEAVAYLNDPLLRDRLIADRIPPSKIEVVHEGVDVDRVVALPHGNLHAALFLPTHSPIVGTIGALVAQKDHHTLIEAAAIVVKQVSDVRFVILGEGELRPQLEKQIKHLHLERHVFLAGFRADVLELLKDIDVFALSSTHEGMCTSLLAAMAAEKPAVATAVGGVPEVVDDMETGFLVPPREPEALARRITQLLKDPAIRRRMGHAGLDRARRLFTVERMVEETAAVYARRGAQSPLNGQLASR